MRASSVGDQLVAASVEEEPRGVHGLPVALRVAIAATHGAMQRLMSYSRQGRPRPPSITSLHERSPNSRCVSDIVRRASDAGMNGPA